MKRKIVQHGSSSLTITLPIKWVEKYNVKKGDDIEVQESGPTLIVATKSEITNAKKVITKNDGPFNKNDLSHLYQLGYDELEIELSKDSLEEIKARLPNCMGFEIVDQKDNIIYIKNIANALETEFDNLLRKAFLVTDEMGKELVQVLESGEIAKLSEVRNLESLNNKYTDICIRILNKRGYKVQKREMQIYEVIKNVERIGDELKFLCDIFMKNKKPDKNIVLAVKDGVNYYNILYRMFYQYTAEDKEKINDLRKKLIKKYTDLLEKSHGNNSKALHHIINLIEKTYEGASAYSSLII